MATPSSRKFLLGKILLLLSSVLFTGAAVEIVYRILLSRKTLYSYNVISHPFHSFSREFGYDYIPNSHAVAASVRKNQLVFWRAINIGPWGNLGDGVHSWSPDDLKILAFGDSFTSNPFSFSWTEVAAEHISNTLGRHTEVMNLGREGYGLLQMVHSAALRAKEFSPDLIIIAFINDDLTRNRFWKTPVTIDHLQRTLTTFSPDSLPPLERAGDVFLLNAELTDELCERMKSQHDAGARLLLPFNKQFDRMLPDNQSQSLYTLSHSFLFDRLLYRDPFHSLRKPEGFIPRIQIGDFAQDSIFLQDTRTLRSLGIPLMFVMLPELSDLTARKSVLNDQQRSLAGSLERLTNLRIVNLFDHLGQLEADCTKYFNVALGDNHTSAAGTHLYAEALARAVQAGYRLSNSHEHPSKSAVRLSQAR